VWGRSERRRRLDRVTGTPCQLELNPNGQRHDPISGYYAGEVVGLHTTSVGWSVRTLIDLCEEQARGCIELAKRLEQPNLRELLLKMARDWMRDAAALRQAASSGSAPPTLDNGSDDKHAA